MHMDHQMMVVQQTEQDLSKIKIFVNHYNGQREALNQVWEGRGYEGGIGYPRQKKPQSHSTRSLI